MRPEGSLASLSAENSAGGTYSSFHYPYTTSIYYGYVVIMADKMEIAR